MICAQFENEAIKSTFNKFKNEWSQNSSFEVFSSGSTGDAKKIILSKEQMVLSAEKTIKFFDLEHGIKALVCLSLETIAGKMMLARSFVGQWNLKIIEPRANPLQNINETFDFLALVPLQLERILVESPEKLKLIKTIIVGGAPVSDSLIKLLIEHKIIVYQTFGMTETVSHFALRKIGFETSQHYKTVDGVEVSERNGCLIVHYPEMFKEPILTNDLVKIYSANEFEWLGRSDFMINSGGIKMNPEKIEQKLAEQIPYSFFITGLHDQRLGQKLALIIENSIDFIPQKLQLLNVLEKYEVPKVYLNVHEFVRTKSGKINRIETLKNVSSDDWKKLI